jgi:hypothetical protein
MPKARIEVNVRRVIDDIGHWIILPEIRPEEFQYYFARTNATELGKLLCESMSPEALAELREALK